MLLLLGDARGEAEGWPGAMTDLQSLCCSAREIEGQGIRRLSVSFAPGDRRTGVISGCNSIILRCPTHSLGPDEVLTWYPLVGIEGEDLGVLAWIIQTWANKEASGSV
jgi:hypothetical protein